MVGNYAAEYRIGRGWSEDELEGRLEELSGRAKNFGERLQAAMAVEAGFRTEESESVVATEAPGPPERDGPFERTALAVQRYTFSDPSVVESHFDSRDALLGRRMLLEIKVLGIRYLCGVVVASAISERGPRESRFGFRYDTLEGHIERGIESFLVEKDHRSGEVRFRVESCWRGGDLPNAWSRLGFTLLSPFYRRLWLRRAHERLRALSRAPALSPPPAGLVHEGPPTEAVPALADTERAGSGETAALSAALGALSGLRTFAAPALLATRSLIAGPGPGTSWLDRRLAMPGTAAWIAPALIGESIADKTPWIPARTEMLPMAGRIATGALAGAALARRWRKPPGVPAATAAIAAGGAAYAATRLRARTGRGRLPPVVLGLAEDAVVAAGSVLLARALARRRPGAGARPLRRGSGA